MVGRYLASMTFLSWFIVTTVALFMWYNPAMSVYHIWTEYDITVTAKVAISLFPTLVLGLIVYGSFRTMTVIGLLVLLSIIGVFLWLFYSASGVNIFSMSFIEWASQPILGFILTMGWQWPKIWRQMTGVVSTVETGGNNSADYHGGTTDKG